MASYGLYNVALILLAFVVSPILVQRLGEERYGVWTLVVSFAGYLAILDLGIHAAIVRLVSLHSARGEGQAVERVFSTALAALAVLGTLAFAVMLVAGEFFGELFDLDLTPERSRLLFLVIGIDIAANLVFTLFLGTLSALQVFLKVNLLGTLAAVLKSVAIVLLLERGHGLMTLALVQLGANLLRHGLQFLVLRQSAPTLRFRLSSCSSEVLRQLLRYGIYGLLITLALRFQASTSPLLIGRSVSVAAVTSYAIPASILEQLEKLALAAIAVLIPLVSSREAVGQVERNRSLYTRGTRYALLALLPVLFVLFTVGDDFLRLWMGPQLESRSADVLQILLVGYAAALPQLMAHGILKGLSRHRGLALLLCLQALANLALSLVLVHDYGVLGVSLGLTLPLLLVNLVLLPAYTCRVLGIGYFGYLQSSYAPVLTLALPLAGLAWYIQPQVESYGELALYAALVTSVTFAAGAAFLLEPELRDRLRHALRRRLGGS
jgi:O-antigen/teichoic acid export membrane protein